MQKIKAKITGHKVHDVGYRVLLVNKALSMGVDNFNAFNTHVDNNQAVIVIIEADDETMDEFKNFVVSVRPEKSVVDGVSFEEYKNNVPPIERIMQSFQMEQWGKGIPIFLQMLDKQDQMLDKQDQMLDKQDQMLGKQDQMLDKQDQMLGKQDQMLDKQDQSISILEMFKEESNSNFADLKQIFRKHDIDAGDRFALIQNEIFDIKDRLSNVENIVSTT